MVVHDEWVVVNCLHFFAFVFTFFRNAFGCVWIVRLFSNWFSIDLFLVSFGVVVGFAWLFSVVLVASVLCVVFMLCQDVEACACLCEFVVILFQVALFLRSCSDCFKLSQVFF